MFFVVPNLKLVKYSLLGTFIQVNVCISVDKIDFDRIRPQWLTLTKFSMIGGVAVVLLGALGVCCKRCLGLIKNRDDDDDDDDDEEEEVRRRRRN